MRSFEMPQTHEAQPSEYAGKEREFENKEILRTEAGEQVVIVDYSIDEGLYIVSRTDADGVTSPLFKISPDKLTKD